MMQAMEINVMGPLELPVLKDIAAACRAHHVGRLSMFGSVAAGQATENSDIDLLVAFDLPSGASYLDAFFGLQDALQTIFGRKVDLVRDGDFHNPYFRAAVETQRVPLFP